MAEKLTGNAKTEQILAFDVYGTLIDAQGVVKQLRSIERISDKAQIFSKAWRDKQLEYTFRRGLMGDYVSFSTCTLQALEFTCKTFNIVLTDEQTNQLANAYQYLPAFEDTPLALSNLIDTGYKIVAFSNGQLSAVEQLLNNAAIDHLFFDIISVEEVQSFKPDPTVYEYLLNRVKGEKQNTWLISSNSFDVIGAATFGMNTAWVRRDATNLLDPWTVTPDLIVSDLIEFTTQIGHR